MFTPSSLQEFYYGVLDVLQFGPPPPAIEAEYPCRHVFVQLFDELVAELSETRSAQNIESQNANMILTELINETI